MATQPQFVAAMPQHVAQTVQPQVVVQTEMGNRTSDPLHRRKNALYGLGVAEVVLGSLSILLAIVAVAIGGKEAYNYFNEYYHRSSYYYYYARSTLGFTYASQGIWGGLLSIITGILGMRVRTNPTRCLYITNITMAVIAANVVGAAFMLSAITAAITYFSASLQVLHSLIAVFTFTSSVLTIVHASIGCCGVCCTNSVLPHQVVIPMSQPSQYVQGPNGQIFLIASPGSPMQGMNVTQPSVMQMPVQAYPQSSCSAQVPQPNMQSPPSYKHSSP